MRFLDIQGCFIFHVDNEDSDQSNKYPKHMFYEKIRIKQRLSYISFCGILQEQQVHFIFWEQMLSLRKHAYSNILKILPPKNENFQIKSSDIFHISAQNIDRGYSLEPPRLDEAVLTNTHNLCF